MLPTAHIWSHIDERKKLWNTTIWYRYHDFDGQGAMRYLRKSLENAKEEGCYVSTRHTTLKPKVGEN